DIVFRIGILIRRRIDNLCSAETVTEPYAREAGILQILVPCEIGQRGAQAHAKTGSVLSKERVIYELVINSATEKAGAQSTAEEFKPAREDRDSSADGTASQ